MSTANGTTSVADDSRIGVTVLSAFSAVWAVALLGLSAAPTAPAAVFTSFIVVAVAVVLLVMRRRGLRKVEVYASPLSAQGRSRVFLLTNIIQAVLFSVAISICIATDNITVLPLVGSVVVGGHFLPLAWAFTDRTFWVVGAVMLVAGASGWALSAMPDITAAAAAVPVCAVNAVLLLVTAARQVRWRPRADSAM